MSGLNTCGSCHKPPSCSTQWVTYMYVFFPLKLIWVVMITMLLSFLNNVGSYAVDSAKKIHLKPKFFSTTDRPQAVFLRYSFLHGFAFLALYISGLLLFSLSLFHFCSLLCQVFTFYHCDHLFWKDRIEVLFCLFICMTCTSHGWFILIKLSVSICLFFLT